MAEFASKGVAGTALGAGIAGLSLGVLNSLGGRCRGCYGPWQSGRQPFCPPGASRHEGSRRL